MFTGGNATNGISRMTAMYNENHKVSPEMEEKYLAIVKQLGEQGVQKKILTEQEARALVLVE